MASGRIDVLGYCNRASSLHQKAFDMLMQNAKIHSFDRSQLPSIVANVVKLNAKHSLESPHLWEVLDILPVAVMISSDRECTRIVGNVAARALLHATPIQNLSRSAPEEEKPPFQVYAKGQVVPSEELPMQKAAATGLPVPRSECELRFDDGQRIFIAGHSVPVFDDRGQASGSIGAFVDVTHIKQLEEENRLLTRELSHRVKNTVSIIQAISNFTIRRHVSSEHFDSYEKRLIAIARAHEILFENLSENVTVEKVVGSAVAVLSAVSERISIRGPSLKLHPQFAQPVVMIIHELGTNSIKYGALSGTGSVEIRWHAENRGGALFTVIDWSELGGHIVEKPTKKGFGSRMIEAAALNLTGGRVTLDYHPGGVQCRLEFPTAVD